MGSVLLEMENIHKKFPGVYALKNVDFELRAGEVHALLGENGAGKSTLIKIIGGIYSKDEGEMRINGSPAQINNVMQAKAYGISVIHQELVLVPHLTVAENIFLGSEPKSKGFIDFKTMYSEADKALREFGVDISSNVELCELTIAQQQMVEIVKAISFHSKIIVMDEPTSSLSDKEVESLFDSVRRLKKMGIGIIYISHRMAELNAIADRVTVMRDGESIATRHMNETNNDELISLMVGREITNYYTRTYNEYEQTVLEVKGLTNSYIKDISFRLKKGEILGFAGLVGAGRSEVMRAIFGIDPVESGEVFLNGDKLQTGNVNNAMRNGIGLVPEDRKEEGIFPYLSIQFNETFKVLDRFIRGIAYSKRQEAEIANKYIGELSIKTADLDMLAVNLSGGNQQKVIISSWLATDPQVLILDEPTRGIDVGTKSEIYTIMNRLARQGVSILMVSSELPEIINMSDRIIVMAEGQIRKELDRSEASQELIMQYAVN